MPYVQRNQAGAIVSLTVLPLSDTDQFLMPDDLEILQFLSRTKSDVGDQDGVSMELFAADLKMIRVVEDLIDLLTLKGVILFSELPGPVQEKILNKRSTREKFVNSNDILVDDSSLL